MNANQIINMVMRMVVRRVLNKGVNAGIDAVGKRMGSGQNDTTPQPNAAQTTKKAKQTMRMARRVGRF